MVGDGLLGGDGGPEGVGLLAPREGWIPACRGPLPPPVVASARGHSTTMFAPARDRRGVREKCDLQSGVSRNFTVQKCAKCSQSLILAERPLHVLTTLVDRLTLFTVVDFCSQPPIYLRW